MATIKVLEQRASPDQPAMQSMLWAARDYLLPMLKNPYGYNERNEGLFTEHMETARRLIGE